MRRPLSLVLMGVLTSLMVLLIAGHGPWAGEVFWAISPGHGLNHGDVPVLGLWALGMVLAGLLGRED